MRSVILDRLDGIEQEEEATILLAIESGSRAWGFHSPDSDYDVRFIYANPIDWHLRIEPGRDVIERPISNELDLSGWDLRKTLSLILKSNAVVLEWLQSPICYRVDPNFRDDLIDFGKRTLRRRPVMWHYLRLAQRQSGRMMAADGTVKLKKYFYVIRPVLALRWIRLRDGEAVPPMNMQALMDQTDLPVDCRTMIDELTEAKRTMREVGSVSQVPKEVDALISRETESATAFLGDSAPEPAANAREEADNLLRKWTRAVDG
ncbi:MAG: nucleotidyltransferase domain-containing protein [Pseudomonadota bacterium]